MPTRSLLSLSQTYDGVEHIRGLFVFLKFSVVLRFGDVEEPR